MHGELAYSTWPALSPTPVVLVPLGSTEQHGPHLPFSTDTIIASAVAERVATDLTLRGHSVVVAPALPYGASGEHQDFPGTVSIGTEALTMVIIELVRSLSTWAGRIVLVNGHGGNLAALTASVSLLLDEGHAVAWAPCAVTRGDAHAGITETSILLHLDATLVDLASIVPGATTPMSALFGRLKSEGVRAVSPTGILGDPTKATATIGAALMAEMCDGVQRRILGESIDPRGCLRDPARRTVPASVATEGRP
ncbi:mycofactocin biosynthesis peptidyl-dipeptidase MftE [Cryobacterium serini]|uniref:Mycofactocin biosynthesis peptidyl-dipeptidase MftE n=1 Tax=Cryobacterium serini TaxID=1259201 RepID=A0A4R9BKF8_9MICO|nr:mycofactocin biosynthesis peptidyl-dipeptidase MftE [Cryobacterium serini]TFD85936.1 mycofactocin biosynthesis peptidyl-dipeptidase MftE [Cryobacterium serini]